MNPQHHEGRRQARAQALEKLHANSSTTVYTDAADYARANIKTAVVATPSALITSVSVRQCSTLQAEETAIALAITQTNASTIITDSQASCRTYMAGRISKTAMHVLAQNPSKRNISIIWTPAHSSLRGNQAAHAYARGLVNRAPLEDDDRADHPLTTFSDITQHYMLSRRTYPPGADALSKEQEVTLRQLQTNTFPHPTRLHATYPTLYTPLCRHCNQPASLYHMVWECQNNPDMEPIPSPTYEQWESELASSDPNRQLWLTERAKTAGRTNGVLD